MRFFRKYFLLLISLLCFISSYVIDTVPFHFKEKFQIEAFKSKLNKKEKETEKLIINISKEIKIYGLDNWIDNSKLETDKLSGKDEFLLIFKNNSLVFWSVNSIPLNDFRLNTGKKLEVYLSGNAWFLRINILANEFQYVGLIKIKNQFSYENKFLKNSFSKSFNLPDSYELTLISNDNQHNIFSSEKQFLFSLKNNVSTNNFLFQTNFIISLFGFIFLIWFLTSFFKSLLISKKSLIYIIYLTICFLIIRFLMIQFQIPDFFYQSEIFNPFHFSISKWFRSLGDFSLNLILLFLITFLIYNNKDLLIQSKFQINFFTAFIIITIVNIFFLFAHYLLTSVVTHSVIPLNVLKIYTFSWYSAIAFLSIGFLMLAVFFITFSLTEILLVNSRKKHFIWLTIIYFCELCIFILIFDLPTLLISTAFWILFCGILIFLLLRKKEINYPIRLLLIFLVSIYIINTIGITNQNKETDNLKVMAVNLATERDYIAELFLERTENEIKKDTVIQQIIFSNPNKNQQLFDYLTRNYFQILQNRYDFQTFICNQNDSIVVQPDNVSSNCFNFFTEIINQKGVKVSESDFYFIDNYNGRINYLGKIDFQNSLFNKTTSLYIDINSQLVTTDLGFPELLIDNKVKKNENLEQFSYAKYKDGKLLAQSGDFQYQLYDSTLLNLKKEFSTKISQKFQHFIFQAGNNFSIIISKPVVTIFDRLIALSYIFVFFLLLVSLFALISAFPNKIKHTTFGFKYRIQVAMISVLIFSLLLVGTGSVGYYIKQYENKNVENLNEKIQSVLTELEDKFGTQKNIENYDNDKITEFLIKFSNIFYTDINLYKLNGELLATSRPEIYERLITSNMMNFKAFEELKSTKPKYIHNENIGSLNFLSAYIPFKNNDGEVLAYLNLPYFTKQSILKNEISTLIVAVVNIYVLLILIAVLIAVFISDKITKPLQLIREKLQEIGLRKDNQPIYYSGNDEIGSLVRDYNQKVVELAESAELLARTERESAWREMAKQIAHEIKNPLTPMKLNVQYLEKRMNEHFGANNEQFAKITSTIIEQIDALSNIANEFSNFAKMPKPENRVFNLCEVIENTVNLFGDSEIYSIQTKISTKNISVFADKEQISRVLINLIQNAIQSIPQEKTGTIEISTQQSENKVVISVKDNGKGISDNLIEKIFEPNFTTKSSGMGLGLAISKNIIESCGGKIWFHTEENVGTCFFVELPVK